MIIFMDAILIFGIKDKKPKPEAKDKSLAENEVRVLGETFEQLSDMIRDQKEFILAILGNFAFRVSSIAIYQFGPMFIQDISP